MKSVISITKIIFGGIVDFFSYLYASYQALILRFVNKTGYSSLSGQILFWILLDILFLLDIAIPLHRRNQKKRIFTEKKSIELIDRMIYFLSKNQYFLNLDQESLGGDPAIALMRSIFNQGKSDYLKSTNLILENIKKVETILNKRVITKEELVYFQQTFQEYQKYHKKEKKRKVIAIIFSLGIYAIFS